MAEHKATIETIVNTLALSLTSFGAVLMTTNSDGWEQIMKGMVLICFGASLEFFKYWGRSKKLW